MIGIKINIIMSLLSSKLRHRVLLSLSNQATFRNNKDQIKPLKS